MNTFDVYDRKNPERLLGSIKTKPPHLCDYFRVAVCETDPYHHHLDHGPVGYIPTTLKYIELHVDWKAKTEEIDTGSPWYRQRTHSKWAVLLTDAPLDLLMKVKEFTPAGTYRVNRRTLSVL